VFGAIMAPRAIPYLDWQTGVYALLSLFVVRSVSVFVALLWSNLDWRDKIFAGWFGPRGLASILFTLIVLDEAQFVTTGRIEAVVFATVVLSIFLHGLSARPGAAWFGRMKLRHPDESETA
jgi:NhaP-type Na+/H+ or K+/H+ antiporter